MSVKFKEGEKVYCKTLAGFAPVVFLESCMVPGAKVKTMSGETLTVHARQLMSQVAYDNVYGSRRYKKRSPGKLPSLYKGTEGK